MRATVEVTPAGSSVACLQPPGGQQDRRQRVAQVVPQHADEALAELGLALEAVLGLFELADVDERDDGGQQLAPVVQHRGGAAEDIPRGAVAAGDAQLACRLAPFVQRDCQRILAGGDDLPFHVEHLADAVVVDGAGRERPPPDRGDRPVAGADAPVAAGHEHARGHLLQDRVQEARLFVQAMAQPHLGDQRRRALRDRPEQQHVGLAESERRQ